MKRNFCRHKGFSLSTTFTRRQLNIEKLMKSFNKVLIHKFRNDANNLITKPNSNIAQTKFKIKKFNEEDNKNEEWISLSEILSISDDNNINEEKNKLKNNEENTENECYKYDDKQQDEPYYDSDRNYNDNDYEDEDCQPSGYFQHNYGDYGFGGEEWYDYLDANGIDYNSD